MPGPEHKSLADRLTGAANAPVRVIASRINFAWGRHPFAPRDDAAEVDGTVIDGMLLRQGPDGRLYGIMQPPEKKP